MSAPPISITFASVKDLLLITPPFTQLNTPYPATAYLKGFLNTKKVSAFQVDLGIEVILQLFSASSLGPLMEQAETDGRVQSDNARRIYALREDYLRVLDHVVAFLQGANPTFARILSADDFLPQASRFEQLDDMEWAFGSMGMHDKAKHFATLYLEDLSDFIIECIDPHFGFSRYAERLGMSANSFDGLYAELQAPLTAVDRIAIELLAVHMQAHEPRMVCFSVPFPGNLYSALRCAQYLKAEHPDVAIAMGGGFANTELRSLSDARVFEFFDYITLDDGERPIELLVANVLKRLVVPATSSAPYEKAPIFKRTFLLRDGKVVYDNSDRLPDYKQHEVGTPDYSDLPLGKYISVIEIANPMHSLWSDGRWNKLTMAHGCYWGKCTFCDISLDYIKRYEPATASMLVDRMEQLIAQTGENGFHFVDEAAPPSLMKALAIEILRRRLTVTWWTNIRFEKSFTLDLCLLLRASGCIAVSGGLEVASDRLLKLIDKGVTVAQVARVTNHFTESGIMVHAYLMYGYPTQTVQETVDSLEMVRQLFELGVIQSGFWHQFALTAHSPVGLNPEAYGVTPHYAPISFANNDVQFSDATGIDHSKFSHGLKKSLFNYMHGIGFEEPLQSWFDFKVPRSIIGPDYIEDCLDTDADVPPKPTTRVLWLGGSAERRNHSRVKKGRSIERVILTFHDRKDHYELSFEPAKGEWLADCLGRIRPQSVEVATYASLKADFEGRFGNFDAFWSSNEVMALREQGLVAV